MIDGFDQQGLRRAYSRFLGSDRVLLTGHSHQAWPDAARDALGALFDDAARFVDDKWAAAIFPKLDSVLERVAARMGCDGHLAMGRSTHELVFRLLSCLPLAESPRIVTTDGEFHSLHRQLSRLTEEGARVDWVPANPKHGLDQRLLDAIVPGVHLVAVSAVFFEDSYVMPRLGEIVSRAVEVGAIALVDAYHAFNVVPLELGPAGRHAFITAGGYKYAGFGDGLCWMRIPEGCALRPLYTGWFADFASLSEPRSASGPRKPVAYGPGAARFAGATFDAAPIYRADAVLQVFDAFGLDVPRLRALSLAQTSHIIARLDALGFASAIATARQPDRRGGFVAVRTSRASEAVLRLRERGIFVDSRGDLLRLGPAPYVTADEIDRGVEAVAQVLACSA